MHKTSYYIINGITMYRVIASVLLLYLLITKQEEVFKWLIALSFFTDSIDGFLARKYKVATAMGSRLDSLGDDLTVLMGILGIAVFNPDFLRQQSIPVFGLVGLFLIQASLSFYRYGKFSSFHTYLAKAAAIFQGSFLILFFFLPQPPVLLFYAAAIITGIELIEEIILVMLLPQWKTDVKGIYWVLKGGSHKTA